MAKIKLLSKSEISKAQNIDKAREISEGLKISRRVDDLRELAAREEQTLNKFREKTVAEISQEISELSKKKEALEKDITSLRRELAKESTLTRDERLHLEKLKEELAEKEKEIAIKSQELDFKEIDIFEALKNAEDSFSRIRTTEESTKSLNQEANRKNNDARQTLQNARTIRDNAVRDKEESEQIITLKQNSLLEKEKALTLQEQENVKMAKALVIEKAQLADQRATLERALDRLRKNRLA